MSKCPHCGERLPADWDVAFMTFDREYFEQHPEVEVFVRRVFPGEHPFTCSSDATAVCVQRLASGLRARREAQVMHEGDPRAEMILEPDHSTPGVYVGLTPS